MQALSAGGTDFAARLGTMAERWYKTVYAVESQNVHSANAPQYLSYDASTDTFSIDWQPTVQEVADVLKKGTDLFLACIVELSNRFEFGWDTSRHISRFRTAIDEWGS
jgi:hypothetical protein